VITSNFAPLDGATQAPPIKKQPGWAIGLLGFVSGMRASWAERCGQGELAMPAQFLPGEPWCATDPIDGLMLQSMTIVLNGIIPTGAT
jgi:hypothetical protein